MALTAIPNELLADIFLRLPTPEDLIRASASCVSFCRLVADRTFLRRFRKLHPLPLLGFIDYKGFHPDVPPNPSAPAPTPQTSTSSSSPPLPGTGLCGTSASSSTDPVTPVGGSDPSSRRWWCATPCTGSISCSPRSLMT
ncbi:unnamed protein product [Triticum turgidum subsp. durum]|uniref:F-box domain-containing protein n=1 Tax=Triticum turgidum subsp. durum TaxID=4567 RepID=A0A9R1P8I9_TRITD|nr:unnamed protein product [Triticum turgidum subsp. durum]